MEAKELRINNYITDNFGDTFKISGVTESGICIDGFGESEMTGMNALMSLSIDNFKPIPLTEEWVLKSYLKREGIERHDSPFYLYKDEFPTGTVYCMPDYCDLVISNNKYYYVIGKGGEEIFYKRIEHVHSLQNLYFSLNGEELTIK